MGRKRRQSESKQKVPELLKAPVRRQPARKGLSLHVYLPPPLRHAIEAAAKQNKRKVTAEVEIALEKHLCDLGLWPKD